MIKSLGIDIGSSSIKVVEIHSGSKSDQIFQFFEHSLDLNPSKDNKLEIIEFLRNLTSTYDKSQTRFVLGFTQNQVATRLLKFPFKDKNKINKTLAFSLEDQIPFSTDKTLFEAKILQFSSSETEVLTCSVLKEEVEALLSFSKDINIDPTVLSAEGFAFANLIENWQQPIPVIPDQPENFQDSLNPQAPSRPLISVYLHLGHSRSVMTTYRNNTLISAHSLNWGGRKIADELTKKYEIPFVEAVKELKTKGFVLINKEGASPDQLAFSNLIGNSLKDLAREVKLILFEVESELQCEFTKITLTGGVSNLKNISAFLTQSFEIPVNRFSTTLHASGLSFEILGANLAQQSMALGLAIEGLKKAKNPAINFRKDEFAKQNIIFSEFKETASVLGRYLAVAIVLLVIYSFIRTNLSETLADSSKRALQTVSKQIPELGKKSGPTQVKRFIREKKSVERQFAELQEISKMNTGLDILKKVSEGLAKNPKNIYQISLFDVKDLQLHVEGFADSAMTVTEIKKLLALQSLNQNATAVVASTPAPPNRVGFAFDLVLDRGLETKTKQRKIQQ